MLVYRLSNHTFSGDLTGEGARRFGGRWNAKGSPVIYTCEEAAVTLLELLVHVDNIALLPNHDLVTIEIPDGLNILTPTLSDLPSNWKASPAPNSTVVYGQDWLSNQTYPLLRVPSVIMHPFSWNILINPLHPEILGKLKIIETIRWEFDLRLQNPSLVSS